MDVERLDQIWGGDSNLYGYVASNPVNAIDPLGLWTVAIGFNVSGGGRYGGTRGTNLVADSNGLHIQQTGGGGAFAGLNAGFTVTGEVTNAENARTLEGPGFQSGGTAGEVIVGEGGVMGGSGYAGTYGGIGFGGGATPGSGYLFGTYTWGTSTLFEWRSLWEWIPWFLTNEACE